MKKLQISAAVQEELCDGFIKSLHKSSLVELGKVNGLLPEEIWSAHFYLVCSHVRGSGMFRIEGDDDDAALGLGLARVFGSIKAEAIEIITRELSRRVLH